MVGIPAQTLAQPLTRALAPPLRSLARLLASSLLSPALLHVSHQADHLLFTVPKPIRLRSHLFSLFSVARPRRVRAHVHLAPSSVAAPAHASFLAYLSCVIVMSLPDQMMFLFPRPSSALLPLTRQRRARSETSPKRMRVEISAVAHPVLAHRRYSLDEVLVLRLVVVVRRLSLLSSVRFKRNDFLRRVRVQRTDGHRVCVRPLRRVHVRQFCGKTQTTSVTSLALLVTDSSAATVCPRPPDQ